MIRRGHHLEVSLLLLIACRLCLVYSVRKALTTDIIQEKIRRLQYDANQWPTFNSTPSAPTQVAVEILVNSFGTPLAATMDYELDIYLRQEWRDDRLKSTDNPSHIITVSRRRIIDQLWVPDLYFLNLKDAKYHDVPLPNVLMRIYGDGRVFYSMRLKLRLSCQMDLNKYPLDSQICPIEMSTYAHPSTALQFIWSKGKDSVSVGEMQIPQFSLNSVVAHPPTEQHYVTGNFSRLSASFGLQRDYGYHLLQTYIPTVLIVAISWVSVWLEQTSTPARVTLGVTTLLTLTSLAAGVRTELPPVSYLKAIDVWIGACMFFVFGALLEFVLVHYLAKMRRSPVNRRKSVKEMFFSNEDPSGSHQNPAGTHLNPAGTPQPPAHGKQTHLLQAKIVDRICRVLMPLGFAIFNVIYWTVYGLD